MELIQTSLFPSLVHEEHYPAAPAQRTSRHEQPTQDNVRHDAPVLQLPRKPTCTPPEAATATGISRRQIRYWIEDGTLLAINSRRDPIGDADRGKRGQLDRWRVVVRRTEAFPRGKYPARALDELLHEITNVEAGR